MKSSTHDNDSIYGGIIGFIFSLVKCFFQHIDGWAIVQSVICALLAYIAVRLFKKIFPEKK